MGNEPNGIVDEMFPIAEGSVAPEPNVGKVKPLGSDEADGGTPGDEGGAAIPA